MRTKGKNLARVEQDRLLDDVLEQTATRSRFKTAEPLRRMCFCTWFLQEKDRV